MFHVKHDGEATVPEAAGAVFGPALGIAEQYAQFLVSAGVERGLIGPREADRIWERHILNSAAISDLIDADARVADVGSGAGLPGIPLAIARPDLTIVLIEPLLRRATFLTEAVDLLGLTSVSVVRGRAEEPVVARQHRDFDVVTSRAVAALDKLAKWCLPLVRPGGVMMALKGDRAESELEEYRRVLTSLGVADARVMKCGVSYLTPPATVVVARRANRMSSGRRAPQPSGRRDR
jgi:16S rRNA (guanine527-N7)-methyltransferase